MKSALYLIYAYVTSVDDDKKIVLRAQILFFFM